MLLSGGALAGKLPTINPLMRDSAQGITIVHWTKIFVPRIAIFLYNLRYYPSCELISTYRHNCQLGISTCQQLYNLVTFDCRWYFPRPVRVLRPNYKEVSDNGRAEKSSTGAALLLRWISAICSGILILSDPERWWCPQEKNSKSYYILSQDIWLVWSHSFWWKQEWWALKLQAFQKRS